MDSAVRLVALLLVLAAVAPGVALGDATGPDTVDVTYTVAHDPSGPTVSVTMRVEMPDRVTELDARLPSWVEVTATDGFDPADGSYQWDGETDAPSIEYTVPTDAPGDPLVNGAYAYVEQADFVGGVGYRYRNPEVGFERHVEVAGTGTVHGFGVSLWNEATTRTTGDGTTVTLVTPPTDGPAGVPANGTRDRAVLDRLTAIDEFFGFDRTDDRIVVYLRPSDAPELGGDVAGRANSGGTMLLAADRATDRTLLAHEYVHTQQDFLAVAATDWLVEGSADYYGYYYAYHAGDLSFAEFRERLNVRDDPRYRDADLRNLTNASETADYRKGRHVAAALDAWMRNRSDGEARLSDVFVTLRARDGGAPTYADGPGFGTADLVDVVSEAAGAPVEPWYDAATGPSSPPPIPDDPALFAHDGEVRTATPSPTATATATPSPTATATATATATTTGGTATSTGTPPSPTATSPTPTATSVSGGAGATATSTDAPTATPGQPGFGAAAALSALAAVALARKRNRTR
ncbi:PGF-CTERM sorting domain-containing protein [Halosegnis marinus]|uniref:PGF-CTERM sorting domain-containing protein n=1 Tax=Halosegnis marinus TaxID=3034023 RepID=A0ABD5ZKY0_9EURY|nr:PGF-CTERM sorting domain-containing protein [Halosegnis sp. DT85]